MPFKHDLHISRKDRKHMVGNVYFMMYGYCLLSPIVGMITRFNISQEIFSIHMLAALKLSLKHRRKHVLFCCNGRKHRCKHDSDSVPSSFDTREHFAYNIASFTGIVINCSVSFSYNDPSNH